MITTNMWIDASKCIQLRFVQPCNGWWFHQDERSKKQRQLGLSENVVYPEKPNGNDHYPY